MWYDMEWKIGERMFKKNDLISNGISMGLVQSLDESHYYIRWLGAGDSMLRRDFVDGGGYQKVGDFEPGTADEILMFGRMMNV